MAFTVLSARNVLGNAALDFFCYVCHLKLEAGIPELETSRKLNTVKHIIYQGLLLEQNA